MDKQSEGNPGCETYGFNFLFENSTFYLEFGSINEINRGIVAEFLNIFATKSDSRDGAVNLNILQELTSVLKDRLNKFVSDYIKVCSNLHKLRDAIMKMEDKSYFYIIPCGVITDTEFSFELLSDIYCLNNGVDFLQDKIKTGEVFGCVLHNYNVTIANGSKKFFFGPKNKKHRVCRYCGKSVPETTFNKKGHTISESLGNKTIITYDECDNCNGHFGEGIEKDISRFFNVHKVNFGIKGKNGIPKVVGKNFSLVKFKNSSVLRFIPQTEEEKNNFPWEIPCKMAEGIIYQNIYKSICKYALGMMDTALLPQFQNTIAWVTGKISQSVLPKVGQLIDYRHFDRHPALVLYTRKTGDTSLPLVVGELHFTCFTLAYIVPTFNGDDDFCEESAYKLYWERFHYSKISGWQFIDFSNSFSQEILLNFKFYESGKNIDQTPDE